MHILIIGRSGSGKSNFARCLARELEGFEDVIVYDPTESLGWPKDAKKYADPELFLTDIFKARSAHVFIDESKTLWDHDEKRASQLIYRLRHNGLLFYLIAQRAMGMVPPNARNQCANLVAFKTSKKDADTLAEEYGENVYAAVKFAPGEALYTDGFDARKVNMVYDDNGIDFTMSEWE